MKEHFAVIRANQLAEY